MKIAIPVDADPNIICITMGRAQNFVVYNTDTDKMEVRKNPAAQSAEGPGLKAVQFIMENDVDAVIASRCGMKSAKALNSAGIKIYQSAGLSVKQNIADLQSGKLAEMTNFMSGHHGGQ